MRKNDFTAKKTITMKDVADLAGVSTATVSYVINDTGGVSKATIKKVNEAIEKINYSPNALARGLRVNETKLIGLFIPDLTSEFYDYLAKGFVDAAFEESYTVVVCGTQYNFAREKMQVAALLENRVDGFVFVGGGSDEEMISSLVKRRIPVILADRNSANADVWSVQFDNYNAIKKLIKYVCSKNYKKIGYISEPLNMTNLVDRYEGYKDGLKEFDLDVNPEFIYFDDRFQLNKTENSYRFFKELVEKGTDSLPEIFITTSDLIATGIVTAAKEMSISIPGDLAVTGFDDAMIARYLQPPLTTIFQDKIEMGKIAWDLLLELIKSDSMDFKERKIVLEGELVVRKSC